MNPTASIALTVSLLLSASGALEAKTILPSKPNLKRTPFQPRSGEPYAKGHSIYKLTTKGGRAKLVASGIVFVDNTSSPSGDGTFENPVDSIQAGETMAQFLGYTNVFVLGKGIPYNEDVIVDSPFGVRISGSGKGYPTRCGKVFKGGGSTPVLEGGILVQNLPFFSVTGIEITDGYAGGNGIEVNDTGKVSIACNDIHDVGGANLADFGILVNYAGNNSGKVSITENIVELSDTKTAIAVRTLDASDATASVVGNRLLKNDTSGISVGAHGTSELQAEVLQNAFIGNSNFGFGIIATTFDSAQGDYKIIGNTISRSGSGGMSASSVTNSSGTFVIAKNTVVDSDTSGIALGSQGTSDATFKLTDNNISFSGSTGLNLQTTGSATLNALLESNSVSDNQAGFNFVEAPGSALAVSGVANNTVGAGNTLDEVDSTGNPSGSFFLNGAQVFLPTTIP